MTGFPTALLRPGERVVWSEAPVQGIRFGPRDLFLMPFSIMWCGFAIFWEVTAATTGADWSFLLFGAFFVVVGLTISIGRFFADAWLRGRTLYALTDRRVLIERIGPWSVLHTIDLAGMGDIVLISGEASYGTVRLGPKTSLFSRGNGFDIWMPALDPTPQLLAIPDARRVFDLIQQARERLTGG